MFTHLLSEVERLREAYGFGILEAMQFIQTHIDEYSSSPDLVMEFELFMAHGKEMFSPVE